MNRGIGKRIIAVAVSLAVFSTTLSVNGTKGHRAQAAQPTRSAGSDRTVHFGISQIAGPSLPQDGKTWTGDYVYYGSYQNEPVKWRVLDLTGNAGSSSVAGGILLQSDRILETMPFEDGIDDAGQHGNGELADNLWSVSDVRTWLRNENGFLSSANFSEKEKAGIMRTTNAAGDSPIDRLQSTRLQRDTMFLLDVADLANSSYGYACEDDVANSGITGSWWLRSAYPKSGLVAGCVLSGGMVFRDVVFEDNGVVPAFNLDPSNVLFVTAADEDKEDALKAVETAEINEWKLTLSEGATLEVDETTRQSDEESDEVSVSYTYTGTDANLISVMITDGDYEDSDTEITYYGKVSEDEVSEDGTVTFELPEEFDEESDVVYLLAEQVNGANRTDYASEPVQLEIPPRHEHVWEWRWDEDEHWEVCVAPNCDLEDEEPDKEEHEFDEDDEGVVTKPATEEEDGRIVFHCIVCDQDVEISYSYEEPDEDDEEEDGEGEGDEDDEGDEEEDDGEEDEHSWVEVIVKNATCTETGIRRHYCEDEDCDESYDEEIPALSATLTHTFGGWVQESAPTTDKEGVSRRTCSVCGVSETQAIPKLVPAHKHDYDTWMSNEKYHWFQCSCGETQDVEEHTWNKGNVLKKATKKREGQIQYRCTECDETVTRTMAKIGTIFSSGIYQYKVIARKDGSPAVSLTGFVKGKSAKVVNVSDAVTWHDVKYTVTKIGDKAFARKLKVQKVVVSDSVEEIGKFAFFLAENIQEITLGTGVTNLGEHAFCHTYKLKQFVVKSTTLKKQKEAVLHGGMEKLVIKVPAKKVKAYTKNIFFTHTKNVKALKEPKEQ